MDQQKLTELLHLQPEEISAPTSFCPSGSELAARLEGDETATERQRLERHLADCSYCRAQTAVLARFMQASEDANIPESLYARARQFGNQPRRRRPRFAARWAAAAVLVVALAGTLTQSQNPASNPAGEGQVISDAELREVRNLDFGYKGPRVLSPADGLSIRLDELTVRWAEVPGSLYYDVRLVDAQGFLLWEDRVKGLSASPPDQLQLVPGERYFVRVDAYLAEAKRVSSNHVKFIYEGRH